MSSATSAANVYSETRPAYAGGKQTQLFSNMSDYVSPGIFINAVPHKLDCTHVRRCHAWQLGCMHWDASGMCTNNSLSMSCLYTQILYNLKLSCLPGSQAWDCTTWNCLAFQAHKPEIQELLQQLCTDLFSERPEKPLDYMIRWLEAEKQRKDIGK